MQKSELQNSTKNTGVFAAISAAMLFGAGTPLAKVLLGDTNPWMLAALLYLGAGLGLFIYRLLTRAPRVVLATAEIPWLLGSIVAGGIIGPVLLMFGLKYMPASGASLLLNAESIFTVLLAWFVFKENFDRRIALGMGAILLGAVVISWPNQSGNTSWWPTLAILGACLAWGMDNNLTRKVSLNDATWIAAVKGLSSGSVNLGLALLLGASYPALPDLAGAMLIGLLAYGISLAFFVHALGHLGTARTGAYFSIAPFFGATLAVCMGAPLTLTLVIAGLLMAFGVWLHLTERHEHAHSHEAMMHDHLHTHDAHHQHEHEHDFPVAAGTRHRHLHGHAPLTHSHPHFPDFHHRHIH